jgi:hypothetical protein
LIQQLEEQLTKAEQDYNQTRCEIEELSCMEKEYVNQGIQTELGNEDLRNLEKVEVKNTHLVSFFKSQT